MNERSGQETRRAALAVVDAVLRRGETAAAALGRQSLPRPDDRALAQAIAGECFRWLGDLDRLIDSATRQRLPDDAKARSVLRIMLAQALRLGTPPHAVIATGLPLLTGGPRRLAHGVFSTLMRKEARLPDAPTLPPEVATRWGERATAIAAAFAEPPPLDLTLKDPAETEARAAELEAETLAPGLLRLPRGRRVEDLPGFAEGDWWVQDFAAAQPARLLGAGEGRRVLDLCAAPGGKTLQLTAAGWRVTALDMSAARLARLSENLTRTGLTAEIVTADALEWQPDASFDAILLDAPCSATGTCRRHPEVLHRIGPRQIAEMAELQRRLLKRAAGWLAPGGRLVYAVCSLERAEGEDQTPYAMDRLGLTPDPIRADELPPALTPTAEGWLRTDPATPPGMDGFFVARFSKPLEPV